MSIRQKAFCYFHQLHGLPHLRNDLLMQLDEVHVLVNCRLLDPLAEVRDISLCYADGKLQSISDAVVSYQTSPESLSNGLLSAQAHDRFAGRIRCESNPAQIVGITLTLQDGKLRSIDCRVKIISADPLSVIRKMLELLPASNDDKRRIFDSGVGTMISSAWNTRSAQDNNGEIVSYNTELAPSSPTVSIIIPIYGRHDFIEYQLAQFANDPDMKAQEILYVIDDPGLCREVRQCCDSLARIYSIAFKVLYLNTNLGYSGANNTGVQHTTAPAILLLNSDVFPTKAGWLTQMLSCAGLEIENLILGARLLYEDESIQHDGMTFHASPFVSHLWTNLHPWQGSTGRPVSCPYNRA